MCMFICLLFYKSIENNNTHRHGRPFFSSLFFVAIILTQVCNIVSVHVFFLLHLVEKYDSDNSLVELNSKYL